MMKRLILILFLIPNFTNAAVIINEVAWMGTLNSANDEWIELYNNGSTEVNLDGWFLIAQDGTPNIAFSNAVNKIISAGGFFLLERTDDTSVPDISADLIYTGALLDGGEVLILKDSGGIEVNKVDASAGWPAGDKTARQTMQRTADGVWITADPTPRAQNASSQSSNQGQATSTVVDQEPTPGVGSESWPVEPQIYANAGKDKTVIVGADIYFSGQALGIKKEPLENARYLWNFGDGAIAENQNVKHIYQYPGEYIVVLDVSSGKFSTSDNLSVKVIPNQLKISEANQDFIKLSNGSNVTLDISGWVLRVSNETFKFPASTFIKANSALMISFSVSGIKIGANEKIELLYSNWSVADSYNKTSPPAPLLQGEGVSQSETGEVKPTTVVNKNNSTSSTSSIQAASVITVEKKDFWTPKKWLGLAIFVGIFSIIGFLFIRHKYDKKI